MEGAVKAGVGRAAVTQWALKHPGGAAVRPAAEERPKSCAGRWAADFKAFIERGNVVDLAIGLVLGTAFALLINSAVSDIFMPFVALLGTASMRNTFFVLRIGNVPEDQLTSLDEAEKSGAITVNYGRFLDVLVTYIITAIILFFIIKLYMVIRKKKEQAPGFWCPKCAEACRLEAVRCPHCGEEPLQFSMPEPPEVKKGGMFACLRRRKRRVSPAQGAAENGKAVEAPPVFSEATQTNISSLKLATKEAELLQSAPPAPGSPSAASRRASFRRRTAAVEPDTMSVGEMPVRPPRDRHPEPLYSELPVNYSPRTFRRLSPALLRRASTDEERLNWTLQAPPRSRASYASGERLSPVSYPRRLFQPPIPALRPMSWSPPRRKSRENLAGSGRHPIIYRPKLPPRTN